MEGASTSSSRRDSLSRDGGPGQWGGRPRGEERDQRDIYNLTFHHEVTSGEGSGIEADFVAALCAKDWGLWRTSKATIEKCEANLAGYALDAAATELITERLTILWRHIDDAPKTARWRLRSRVGDRVRWYEEPEEEQPAGEYAG
jgi:hypothetical protein